MRTLFCFVVCLTLAAAAIGQASATHIRNVTIVDGTGKPGYSADLTIVGNRIARVGKANTVKPRPADRLIDGKGLVISPGFIDIHNHSESGLLREGTAANQVSQGITTLIVGPDGGSPPSLAEYFAKLDGNISVNVGAFIGHGTIRTIVMQEDYKRPATADELAKLEMLVTEAMRQGAFGLSSGLEYDAGFAASTEELIALSKVAARYGGIYMTHMRDEEEGVLNAIREAIRIGRESKAPVHISHIKMGNSSVWGKSTEAIAMIDGARKAGQDITADAYPYTAWASTITVLVPSRKHEDPSEVQKGINALGGADKVLITSCKEFPAYEGKTLEQAAEIAGTSPVETYIEIVKKGGAGVIGYGMSEPDVKAFYQAPWVMTASDGGIGSRHPRGSGTFPRVLGRFVRENNWLTLEEAVRKMTSLPAARLGLKDRGTIRKGFIADLVLFDPKTVIDNASYVAPQALAGGIKTVFVNGVEVWDGKSSTGARPGMILKRQ